MTTEVHRADVQALTAEGAQLVDVLPEQEFEEEHLPGAINMPLGLLDRLAPRLQRDRGVIVYCYDYQ
jgi:rhodanese-related sulfurtransferase